MQLKRGVALVLACGVMVGCGSKAEKREDAKPTAPPAEGDNAAAAQSSAPGVSPELAAMLQRELPALGKQKVNGKGFSFEVEGKSPPDIQPVDNRQLVKVDLGTSGPMQCFYYPEPLDAAGSMAAILTAAQKSVEFRRVLITDVQHVDEEPVLFSNSDYLANSGGKKAMGQLKMMVHVRGEHSLLCMHDEPGYQATFKRIAMGVAASFAPAGWSKPNNHYAELQVVKLGQAFLGFSLHTCTKEKARTLCESTDAILATRGPGQFMAVDTVTKETSDASGAVLSKLFVNAEGGEVSTNLMLERTAASDYSFKGTVSGKEVSGNFKTRSKDGITSEAELRRVVLDVVARQQPREVDQYLAGVAPDAATLLKVEPGPRAGTVNIIMAGKTVLNEVDENGLGKRSELPLGQVVMSFERVFVRGIP